MKRYNVVWADDEIHLLLDEFTLENLEEEGIFVVGKATHSEELDKVLEELHKRSSVYKPDAVIVDANFSISSFRLVYKKKGMEAYFSIKERECTNPDVVLSATRISPYFLC